MRTKPGLQTHRGEPQAFGQKGIDSGKAVQSQLGSHSLENSGQSLISSFLPHILDDS